MLGAPPRPSVAVEPEPDLTDDDLRVLLADDATPAAGAHRADAAADDGAEDSTESAETPDANDELARLRQDLARTQGALAVAMRQPGAAASTQDPIKAFSEKFFGDRYADIPAETKAFFEEYGKGLVDLVTQGFSQRLAGIERTLQDSSGKQVLDQFESQLETIMSRAGLADAEREIYKESVMMDGLRRYGNSFTTAQAIKLFRDKHKKVLDARVSRQAQDEDELDRETDTAPPPTRRGGNLVARDNVVDKLMKSNAPENSFGGKNWRQHIARRMKQVVGGGA